MGSLSSTLLLETHGDWQMAKSLVHFKRANELWRFGRIVIVDKDLREVKVLRQKFPEACILLCHFHVIKWPHDTIRMSSKYVSYEVDVLTEMKHTITNMTYARTEADYVAHRVEFKSLSLSGGGKNCGSILKRIGGKYRDMGFIAYRVDLPHFQNHTNNRVESLFGKVKQ
ncbi:hypothetical protein F444_15433 [Phytophthora nicotianae P1976]|nr:hypothetical protein F444_15433 [Phytophthora nicotianae P1976]